MDQGAHAMARIRGIVITVSICLFLAVILHALDQWTSGTTLGERIGVPVSGRVEKTDEEWRRQLTPEQYQVTRRKGTEPAFSGEHWNTKTDGVYQCICCGQPLFDASTKFDSGTG